MANTTNFGWETPDDTDLVKDGAAAMRTLGSAIDTSMMDLKGGTTGQILSKNSNTDMDFTWIANDTGDITSVVAGVGMTGGGTSGAVTLTNDMASTITASGDIVVGTGSGTYDNLPIGTTGQVLTADTTVSPYKVKWAAAGGASFVGCALYQSTNISVANDSSPVLTWDSERFDTDGFHSTTTNTSRITIPTGKGGKYLFIAVGAYAANSTGYRAMSLKKNGSDDIILNQIANLSATIAPWFGGTCVVSAVAGDYFEAGTNQTSGGNLNFLGRIDYNQFAAIYLGA